MGEGFLKLFFFFFAFYSWQRLFAGMQKFLIKIAKGPFLIWWLIRERYRWHAGFCSSLGMTMLGYWRGLAYGHDAVSDPTHALPDQVHGKTVVSKHVDLQVAANSRPGTSRARKMPLLLCASPAYQQCNGARKRRRSASPVEHRMFLMESDQHSQPGCHHMASCYLNWALLKNPSTRRGTLSIQNHWRRGADWILLSFWRKLTLGLWWRNAFRSHATWQFFRIQDIDLPPSPDDCAGTSIGEQIESCSILSERENWKNFCNCLRSYPSCST